MLTSNETTIFVLVGVLVVLAIAILAVQLVHLRETRSMNAQSVKKAIKAATTQAIADIDAHIKGFADIATIAETVKDFTGTPDLVSRLMEFRQETVAGVLVSNLAGARTRLAAVQNHLTEQIRQQASSPFPGTFDDHLEELRTQVHSLQEDFRDAEQDLEHYTRAQNTEL